MLRDECVICEKGRLTELLTFKDYPITPSSSRQEASTDEFNDCIFSNCTVCGCIQLQNLIDPVKLYEHSHNSTEHTPTWKEHHTEFAEFISQRTSASLLEIGGNSGILYTLLKEKIPKYTILDICDSDTRPKTVMFLQGNCEDYNFGGYTHVALSHTFEHLYSPRRFVENLSAAQVSSVFLSIPNMDHLYVSKNISILHNEHTFFVGDTEIKYIFSLYGYSCASSYNFKFHSIFYHFVYQPGTTPMALCNTIERSLTIQTYMNEFERSVKDTIINFPCFICPAGHYGQKIYYYLKQCSKYILGFIDNDVSKQGLRVYGTEASVYSPNVLQEYKHTPISIVLYAGPYVEELIQQLNTLHPNIFYIKL